MTSPRGDEELPDSLDVVLGMVGAPPPLSLTGQPKRPAERARSYIEAARSAKTRKAYVADWKHFAACCRRQDLPALPRTRRSRGSTSRPAPAVPRRLIASRTALRRSSSALSALGWSYTQRGRTVDRRDRHIATLLAGIRNTHAQPTKQKEAVLPADVIAMFETLERALLRGLRDRATVLIGFAGGLRCSAIVGLDIGHGQTEDGWGWIEIFDKALEVT
jgi:integrase